MEQLKENFKKNGTLHHAYIIEGKKESVLKQLLAFFEHDLGISLANNPDYWRVEFPLFGVEEARLLKERQSFFSASAQKGTRKLFVICAERFSVEAQNALLKVLEEPTAGTHIFFILPDVSRVLPTVRSRIALIRAGDDARAAKNANAFFAASHAEREKLITPIAEEKDRAGAFALLAGIEDAVKERLKQTSDMREYNASLSAIHKCRAHLSSRAPSIKMLLEYVAAALPVGRANPLQ